MNATLKNLTDHNYGLKVCCNGCSRFSDLDVNQLVERYGLGMELPSIGQRAKCTECGHKGGRVQVDAHNWKMPTDDRNVGMT